MESTDAYLSIRHHPKFNKPMNSHRVEDRKEANHNETPILDPNYFPYEKYWNLFSLEHWDTQLWLNLVFLKSVGFFTDGGTKSLQKAIKTASELENDGWRRYAVWAQYLVLNKDRLEHGEIKIGEDEKPKILSTTEIRDEIERVTVSYFSRMRIDIQPQRDYTGHDANMMTPQARKQFKNDRQQSRPGSPSSLIVLGERSGASPELTRAVTDTGSHSTTSQSPLEANRKSSYQLQRDGLPRRHSFRSKQGKFKSIPVLHKYQIDTKDNSHQQRCYSADDIGFGSIWSTFDGRVAFTDNESRDYYLYFHNSPGCNETDWDGFIYYLPMDAKLPPHFYPIRVYPAYLPGAVPNSFTQIPNPVTELHPSISLLGRNCPESTYSHRQSYYDKHPFMVSNQQSRNHHNHSNGQPIPYTSSPDMSSKLMPWRIY